MSRPRLGELVRQVEDAYRLGCEAAKHRRPASSNPYDDFDRGAAFAVGHARTSRAGLDRLMQQQARMLGLEG